MSDFGLKVTSTLGKAKLWTVKKSPELLLAGGIVSGVACLYFACKGTLHAHEIIDKHNERIDEIHQLEVIRDSGTGECTDRDVKVNLVRAYGATAKDSVVTFGPAVIFGTLSLSMILCSHGIMKKRNVALAASLATVRTAFDEYRGRVVRDLGKPMDEHFLYDTVEEVREKEVVTEDGKKKKVKEKVMVPTKTSAYDRFFDESNPNWEKDGSANYIFIRSQMLHLQNKLISRGYLYLNEVYTALDLPITIAGQSAGWVYDYNDKANTMLYFDGFDVDEIENSRPVRDLQNGYERNVLLKFVNIQDNIHDDVRRVDPSVATI